MKICRTCGKSEPEVSFYLHGPGQRYKMLDCGSCTDTKKSPGRKSARRKKLYNLSPEEYTALLVVQNNCCAICGLEKTLHVDHDHNTGAVRGLLCARCNMALGALGDTVENLTKALNYLSW